MTEVTMEELLAGVKDSEDVRAEAEARLARLSGEEQHVAVLAVEQEQLRDNGLLLDLDVKGLSQFYCAIDWNLDLGIPQTDARQQTGRLTPGRKWLIDIKKFRSLETQARRNLERHGFRISVFGGYIYVPDGAFAAWHEKHLEITGQWDDLKRELLAKYDDHLYQLELDFSKMARDTWLGLVGRAATSETASGFLAKFDHSMERFVRCVVDAAMSKVPTKNQIRDELRIILRPATFLLGSEMAREYYEESELRTAAQQKWDELNYWRRKERAMAQEAEERLKTIQAEEFEKRDSARREKMEKARAAKVAADQEIERQRIETEYVREAKAQIVREAMAEMTSPIVEVMNSLRGDVLENVREATQNIQKHGRVLGKTAERIDNTITMFRLLNSAGNDLELAAAIDNLENAMNQSGGETKRDTAGIEEALRRISGIASEDAARAARETGDDMFDYLEI